MTETVNGVVTAAPVFVMVTLKLMRSVFANALLAVRPLVMFTTCRPGVGTVDGVAVVVRVKYSLRPAAPPIAPSLDWVDTNT